MFLDITFHLFYLYMGELIHRKQRHEDSKRGQCGVLLAFNNQFSPLR